MLLFPIGFFYACFMVESKRIAAVAAQGKCSFPWDGIEAGAQTPASISSSRLQDRNFTGAVYNCALFHRGFGTFCFS